MVALFLQNKTNTHATKIHTIGRYTN